MRYAVQCNGEAFQFADDSVKQDKDLALDAVQSHGDAIKYIPASLALDQDVVMASLKAFPLSLRHVVAGADLLKTVAADLLKDFITQAVSVDGMALAYAPKQCRKCKAIVSAAVSCDGMSLKYASSKLRNDDEIVLSALNSNPMALKYANPRFRQDLLLLIPLARKNPNVLHFAEDLSPILREFEPCFLPAYSFEEWKAFYRSHLGIGGDEECMTRFYIAAVCYDGMLVSCMDEKLLELELGEYDYGFIPAAVKQMEHATLLKLAIEQSHGRALQHIRLLRKGKLSLDIYLHAIDKAIEAKSHNPRAWCRSPDWFLSSTMIIRSIQASSLVCSRRTEGTCSIF